MYPDTDKSPMSLEPYKKLDAVVDIIYNPAVTKLLAEAKKRNITAVNGLLMLVAQAVYAYEHFTGRQAKEGLIEEIMGKLPV